MDIGTFTMCLTVKDLEASRAFYEKFGFTVVSGNASQNWLVLQNRDHKIGIFQGMFEKNMLTFIPGWNSNGEPLDTFTDVRELQRQLKAKGVKFESEADETTTGASQLYGLSPRW